MNRGTKSGAKHNKSRKAAVHLVGLRRPHRLKKKKKKKKRIRKRRSLTFNTD
jgi:hypothetical protein